MERHSISEFIKPSITASAVAKLKGILGLLGSCPVNSTSQNTPRDSATALLEAVS